MDSRFQNLGEMMILGRNDAALSPTFIEGLTIEGPIGHTGKAQITPFVSISLFFRNFHNSQSIDVPFGSKENSILD